MDKYCYVKGFKIYREGDKTYISIGLKFSSQLLDDGLLQKGYACGDHIVFHGESMYALLECFPVLKDYVFELDVKG